MKDIEKLLIEQFGLVLDVCIRQRFPMSQKLSEEERVLLAELGLSYCRTAVALVERTTRLTRAVDSMFWAGAGLLDVCEPKHHLAEWMSLVVTPEVRSNVVWHFQLLVGLLNIVDDEQSLLAEMLFIPIASNDKSLRDALFEGILEDELKVRPDARRWLAAEIIEGNWEAKSRKSKLHLQSLAKRAMAEMP